MLLTLVSCVRMCFFSSSYHCRFLLNALIWIFLGSSASHRASDPQLYECHGSATDWVGLFVGLGLCFFWGLFEVILVSLFDGFVWGGCWGFA